MTKITLKANKRDVFGRKVKKLRQDGLIPANVFGKKIKSESISVDKREFEKVFKEAGETQIIDLSGKPVLISEVQRHPVSGDYLHVDFRQVDLTEAIKAHIPVVLEGDSPAEKQSIGTVVQQVHEIEVEALPSDLPERITVDQSVLAEVDQAIFVKDLKVNSKVKVLADGDTIVAKVEPPLKEEVVETPPAPAEGSTEGEAPTEGEAVKPAEGEKTAAEEPKQEENNKS